MRFYAFTNYYLSSLQKGLQAQHATAEMFVDYGDLAWHPAGVVLDKWAEEHKTTIILNGGNSADLTTLYQELAVIGNELDLPVSCFEEDKQSLNGAMTCVAIVVPENVYSAASAIRAGALCRQRSHTDQVVVELQGEKDQHILEVMEYRLANILNRYSLAN